MNGELTHAVSSPCVLQLVPSPGRGDGLRLVGAEMAFQLLDNGLCRQQRAVQVECHDCIDYHGDGWVKYARGSDWWFQKGGTQ